MLIIYLPLQVKVCVQNKSSVTFEENSAVAFSDNTVYCMFLERMSPDVYVHAKHFSTIEFKDNCRSVVRFCSKTTKVNGRAIHTFTNDNSVV